MKLEDVISRLTEDQKQKITELLQRKAGSTPKSNKVLHEVTVTDSYTCNLCRNTYNNQNTYKANYAPSPRKYEVSTCPECKPFLMTLEKETIADYLLEYLKKRRK